MVRTERTEYIYVLLDGNQKIFYCGRSRNVEKRLNEHIEEALAGGSSRKCKHIRELIERGDVITIKKVDEAPASEIAQLEAFWINKLDFNVDDLGYTVVLFNGNGGSQGNVINEAKLRDDIQDHKRRLKKPKKTVIARVGPPPTPEQVAEVKRLFETDPLRFHQLLEARRFAEAERSKAA
jgi:hypothetical protein